MPHFPILVPHSSCIQVLNYIKVLKKSLKIIDLQKSVIRGSHTLNICLFVAARIVRTQETHKETEEGEEEPTEEGPRHQEGQGRTSWQEGTVTPYNGLSSVVGGGGVRRDLRPFFFSPNFIFYKLEL